MVDDGAAERAAQRLSLSATLVSMSSQLAVVSVVTLLDRYRVDHCDGGTEVSFCGHGYTNRMRCVVLFVGHVRHDAADAADDRRPADEGRACCRRARNGSSRNGPACRQTVEM